MSTFKVYGIRNSANEWLRDGSTLKRPSFTTDEDYAMQGSEQEMADEISSHENTVGWHVAMLFEYHDQRRQ